MTGISRRAFLETVAVRSAAPLALRESPGQRFDPLFDNFMPHWQVVTVPIAEVLSEVTGFDFAPRVVGEPRTSRSSRSANRASGASMLSS
jgi:hypothetical protein